MPICPSCSAAVEETALFCSSCGEAIRPSSQAPTRLGRGGERAPRRGAGTPAPRPSTPARTPSGRSAHGSASWLPSPDSLHEGRFLPGAMLAGRYRIVGLVGRGGMGEVYRADDLKLGQAVALKFLPEAFVSDPGRLERFYNEVRIARQISHPNVCRVYDVGEIDGHHFISMELVDGEDLASLLRRIGRLPGDKAVEIARQLCAGLAAAHDRGVLHRDLKPGNVMIDGRGRARITDFGLAAIAGEVEGLEVRAGTPTYMAPEQLAGREVTLRSDIYALGLVLYEVVTGRAAFEAKSIEELGRLHTEMTPVTPSSRVQEVEPAVERIILRCLERDPRDRPSSALAVAAALPGGDPLAAALAAGETPSPEMVAAAGEVGGLRPLAAVACLAVVVTGLGSVAFFTERISLPGRVTLPKPPQVLEERGRQIVRALGHEEPAADSKFRFTTDADFLAWVRGNDPSPGRWNDLAASQPPAISFWYRESPRHLETVGETGIVGWADPPMDVSGMRRLSLDVQGRLVRFEAVPVQVETPGGLPHAEPAWGTLFDEAGLDMSLFRPVTSTWTPPVYADARAAWEGVYPSRPGTPIRIEAASYRGKPVYFEIVGPWSRPERAQAFEPPRGLQTGLALDALLVLGALGTAIVLARKNLRVGRGDRRGAFRVALFVLVVSEIALMARAHHGPSIAREFQLFIVWTGVSLFMGGMTWLLYLALEPTVRRRWPDSIISWNRLLAGRFRDPLVGRDVLLGCAAGALTMTAISTVHLAWEPLGGAPLAPTAMSVTALLGAREVVAGIARATMNGLVSGMFLLFFITLARVLSRNHWSAYAVFWAIVALMTFLVGSVGNVGRDLLVATLAAAILTFTLARFGLLAAAAFQFLARFDVPLTFDLSRWYAGASILSLALHLVVAGWAFYVSLGGRPLLSTDFLEE